MTAPRPDTTVAARDEAGVRLRQPDGSLLTYYLLLSFITGPLFPFTFLYYYFRYHTLRYEFDEEGVTMRWGILFRREISLTYARIQDIHLTSNVVERWLGLARIQVQTASGSASAEMTIEGLKDFEAIRDDLYSRMRGVRGVRGGGRVVRVEAAGARVAAVAGDTGTAGIASTRDVGAEGRGGDELATPAGGSAATGLVTGGSVFSEFAGGGLTRGELDAGELATGELAAALQEAALELRRLREALAESGVASGGGQGHA